jgi:4-hydroxy 2-oxovalerate aldolase
MKAMKLAGVDIVELGFRSLKNDGFKGACAFTTDTFISNLSIPDGLKIGVMVNGSELISDAPLDFTLKKLFPNKAINSLVSLVRIACHVHEFIKVLPAAIWLKENGYQVGFNLMQISDCSENEIKLIAREAALYPIDCLYFADSMGSLRPNDAALITRWLSLEWQGAIGAHTHDNLGLALSNTLCALDEGATWVDSTVTGMGRGPGNAHTEELAIEIAERRGTLINLVPLMSLIQKQFKPMQEQYGWGKNSYYYLAGKYGIHPTYIQKMLSDSRFEVEDLLAVIEHLRKEGGKKFNLKNLDAARHFYLGEPAGTWSPRERLHNQDVLLLATGPGVELHRKALEKFISQYEPIVMALNTQDSIDENLIDFRIACHPLRLLADCETHTKFSQPLITPFSMLPNEIKISLGNKTVLDFGLNIQNETFVFGETSCTTPASLVMAYAIAVAVCGQAKRIFMAGFDGYPGEDPRNEEMNHITNHYYKAEGSIPLLAITPTRYNIQSKSVYGLIQ